MPPEQSLLAILGRPAMNSPGYRVTPVNGLKAGFTRRGFVAWTFTSGRSDAKN